MDPNTALHEIRDARDRCRDAYDAGDRDALCNAAGELLDPLEALDEWLCHGGFLPTPWALGHAVRDQTQPNQ